jgi:Asp-tRNA(Asn)/Glu-tRNA(Gln) amidotransferase A subunit family amidase
MSELIFESASSLAQMIRQKQVSCREAIEAYLQRIERVNPLLNAYIHLDAEGARRQALAADEALARGEPTGPLHGVPFSMKSSIEVAGFPSECGSKLRQGVVAGRDATLVGRLRQAGAVILGNTNVPDLLMAYETDNSLYGRTNNPWDRERTPGGSSGGESAAIAAGCSAAGFGSDGGGSVRVPAHFCGIYGLKPTPGLIPRTGHWPACVGPASFSALVGPMARSAEDLELLLRVTAGPENHDSASAPVSVDPVGDAELEGLEIGYFEDDGAKPVTPETRQAIQTAVRILRGQGFRVEPFEMEHIEEARQLWWVFFGVAGAALTKPLVEGREQDLHPFARDLLAPADGSEYPSFEQFMNMWVERDRLRWQLLERMGRRRALLCPVAGVPAFRHRERVWSIGGRKVRYPRVFSYCQIFNLLSNPSVVVPVGRSPEGLPIGVQIVGRHFEDPLILGIARRLGAALGEWQRPPEAILEKGAGSERSV